MKQSLVSSSVCSVVSCMRLIILQCHGCNSMRSKLLGRVPMNFTNLYPESKTAVRVWACDKNAYNFIGTETA
jgi:5-methylcytosine-specific restriction endonuclease McrA